jgi:hypothetical protein
MKILHKKAKLNILKQLWDMCVSNLESEIQNVDRNGQK